MEKIKKIRKQIDELIFEVEQTLEDKRPAPESARAYSLVRTKLQEAKMWCGKVLEEMNQPLPEQYRDYCDKREKNEI